MPDGERWAAVDEPPRPPVVPAWVETASGFGLPLPAPAAPAEPDEPQ